MPSHPIKFGVGVAMSRRRIIGPIFFNETINAQRRQGLLEPFINQLDGVKLTKVYSQQNAAAAHSTTINWAIGKCKILTKVIHLT
jgi:hypothetical protein